MKFGQLSEYLYRLEQTSSRLEITQILADLFDKSDDSEMDKVCYLVLGRVVPRFSDVVFNIAEKMMLRAISDGFDMDLEDVVVLYKHMGDLGDVVEHCVNDRKNQVKNNLTVSEVFNQLLTIADESGEGSQERKIKGVSSLLKSLDSLSCRYVARIPVGKLRLGFSDKTILDALSWMETGGKSKSGILEKAYNIYPDVGYLARCVKLDGVDKAVSNISSSVGVPMLPMLAQRLKSPTEMIEKMKDVVVEPKFDGLRIQIHFKKGKDGFVKSFTRNLNETSWMFPELAELEKQINAESVILDVEAMGVDQQRKTLANFQSTMTRRRKHDIEKTASKIGIKFFVFDLMYLNGESIVDKPYTERRQLLEKTIKGEGVLELVDYDLTNSSEVIEKLMNKYLVEGLEGVIVKRKDSKYVAGRTGWRWVKMKEEEGSIAKLSDTIDAVVMGYYAGRGKRTKFGVGGFLVGVSDNGRILSLTKIGTGLTDDQFVQLKKRLSKIEVIQKPKQFKEIDNTITPDYWVNPGQIVEIAADEITKSPIHSSGYALRFPRLVRFRDDKDWDQATSLEEIREMFEIK